MQKIKEYEAKVAAAKEAEAKEQNDLLLNILPDSKNKSAPVLVDDATQANSPGNSDNEDPTINDDEEEEDEHTQTETTTEESLRQQQQEEQQPSLPGSPLSILSMNTKPALIHPPRSISRVSDGETNNNESTDGTDNNAHSNPLGILCGCI